MKITNEQSNYGWSTPDSSLHHNYNLPKILNLLPKGVQTILDAGCGNGYVAGYLANQGYEVVGIDVSTDGIGIARKKYSNCRFEICSVYDDLSEIVDHVDMVISSEVIEHLYYPQRFVNNMWSIIRLGGYILLTTPYHGYIKNLALSVFNQWDKHHTSNLEGGHIKFFSERTLKNLLIVEGFDEIAFNNTGRMPWLWKSILCIAK